MAEFNVLQVKYLDSTVGAVTERLTAALLRIRERRFERQAASDDHADNAIPRDAEAWLGAGTTAAGQLASGPTAELNGKDHLKIHRRAERIHKARLRASGLAHLSDDARKRLLRIGGGVRMAVIRDEHEADLIAAKLHEAMPWMAQASDYVWRAARNAVRLHDGQFPMEPVLPDGAPGTGKTHWAKLFVSLIGAPSSVMDATNEAAGFGLVGLQRGWDNSHSGRLVELIMRENYGNPILIIDEVEKAGDTHSRNGHNYALTHALLPLLERQTAKRWMCPEFKVPFDMSWVSWVLISNDANKLPEPLRSRVTEIDFTPPSIKDLTEFAAREGQRRGLSEVSVSALCEALLRSSFEIRGAAPSLRTVIRMLDRADELEHLPKLRTH